MQNLPIPDVIDTIDASRWETFQPFFEALQQAEISPEDRRLWLENWSKLRALLSESYQLDIYSKNHRYHE